MRASKIFSTYLSTRTFVGPTSNCTFLHNRFRYEYSLAFRLAPSRLVAQLSDFITERILLKTSITLALHTDEFTSSDSHSAYNLGVFDLEAFIINVAILCIPIVYVQHSYFHLGYPRRCMVPFNGCLSNSIYYCFFIHDSYNQVLLHYKCFAIT